MTPLQDFPLLLAIFVILVLAECIWRLVAVDKGYSWSGSAASIGVAAGNLLFRPLSTTVFIAVAGWLHVRAPWQLPVDATWVWVVGFFAVDFAYYWFHRLSHTVRWLWATHAVHHSPVELVLPAALRLGWTELLSGGWIIFAALAWLGLPPVVIGSMLAFNLLYQFPLHTEAVGRLGPLEWIFNTPSHHRAHHSSDEPYLDRNFGGVLIIWDRLFGTFRAEPDGGGLHYGLVGGSDMVNPLRIAFHEWGRLLSDIRRAPSASVALRVMFGRP